MRSSDRRARRVWLAEVVGRLLWLSERPWLRFVGAMLSVGSLAVGVGLMGKAVIRRYNKRHLTHIP